MHKARSTNETSLTKDTVKRQNSMKKDSGMKERYSRTSIFGRIYQHYTTREQTTFTLNHHHTTTSDNSRLPENMPKPCFRVLPEQNNLDICPGAAKEEVYGSIEQLRFKTLQLFIPNSKRLGGYTQWVHFFLQKSAPHSERIFKTEGVRTTRQKEPEHSIRAPFQQGSRGAFQRRIRKISRKDPQAPCAK